MMKAIELDKNSKQVDAQNISSIVLKVEVEIKMVSMDELLACYDYETVLDYCASCGNAEKNHSCPTHAFEPKAYVSQYNHAAMILTTVDTKVIKDHIKELESNNYPSRVYEDYVSRNPDSPKDWNSMLSMYAFNRVKDEMADRLLEAENVFSECTSLPPGACTRCAVCLKKYGEPCCRPEKLRYSLEALGFLVSDIYKNIFDKALRWTSGELPESFTTCSALISKEPINQEVLMKIIGDINIRLR